MRPQHYSGFTLIELVTVIVILSILSVTAAPRFFDLASDARKANLEGIEASIKSSITMFHAKTLIAGIENGAIKINNQTFRVVNGYPAVQRNFDGENLAALLELDDKISHGTFDENKKYIFYDVNGKKDPNHHTTLCAIYYSQAEAGKKPKVEYPVGGPQC